MGVKLGTQAEQAKARKSKLTRSDVESLATKQWTDDSRITLDKLLYDLVNVGKKFRGHSREDRETIRTDALVFIVESETIRDHPCGGSAPKSDPKRFWGMTPYRRDWVGNGPCGLTLGAYRACEAALRHAAEQLAAGQSAYAQGKRRKETPSADLEAIRATIGKIGELAEFDEYVKAHDMAIIGESSREDLAAVMGLSLNATRCIERALHGLSNAACAAEWRCSIGNINSVLTRGTKELASRYASPDNPGQPDPHELRNALAAATTALHDLRADAARESLIDYATTPTGRVKVDDKLVSLRELAEQASADYLQGRAVAPNARRALVSALIKALDKPNPDEKAERAQLLSAAIERQLAAEHKRESEKLRGCTKVARQAMPDTDTLPRATKRAPRIRYPELSETLRHPGLASRETEEQRWARLCGPVEYSYQDARNAV